MKSGYPPIIINKEERESYYRTHTGSVTENWEEFIKFTADKVEDRVEYINKLKEEEIKINKK